MLLIGAQTLWAGHALADTAPARLVDWAPNSSGGAARGKWKIERFGDDVKEASLAEVAVPGSTDNVLQASMSSFTERAPGAHLVFPVNFQPGHAYRVAIEISAAQPAQVKVMMRKDAAPYDIIGVRGVKLDANWQRVTFDAAWPLVVMSGAVRVMPTEPSARVLVRRLTIDDLGLLPLGVPPVRSFPSTLIGLHVNKLGQHDTWPKLGQGLIRLWDTKTNWNHLAPTPEEFDQFSAPAWKRLDLYVDYVRRNDPTVAILYPFGQPPRWASASPYAPCAYGMGTCGAPASMDDWRHYVRTLAQRYKGRIRYWELWNEPDYRLFYVPTRPLTELAQAAREELKAVDPENMLVSPGFTHAGIGSLEDFLRNGGGKYVDAVGFHWYYDGEPEKLAPLIYNVRQVMKAYGAGDKPLWNTEGSPLCQRRVDGQCVLNDLTPAEQDSVVDRAILTMWLNGIEGYAYFFLEGMEGRSISLLTPDFRSLSRSATQLAMFSQWMVGGTAADVIKWGADGHAIEMRRGGRSYYIAWSERREEMMTIPRTWSVVRYQTLGGSQLPLPDGNAIPVGRTPVLLDGTP
jgi:hypothetical protein